jgi:hypothetical protein
MDKIMVLSDAQDDQSPLILWLTLLFPECKVEVHPRSNGPNDPFMTRNRESPAKRRWGSEGSSHLQRQGSFRDA